jgi:hypothetical protein
MLILAILLQANTAPCAAVVGPPPELAGWSSKTPITASAFAEQRVAVRAPVKARLLPITLPLGEAFTATLRPSGSVFPPVRPSKLAAEGSSSGIFTFTAPEAGRYRVALGVGAWVDVVAEGQAVTSVTHGHGPACTGIRKMVDFDLKAGRHLLQVVGSPTPKVDIMVVRLR